MSINFENLLLPYPTYLSKDYRKKYCGLKYENNDKIFISKGIILKKRNRNNSIIYGELIRKLLYEDIPNAENILLIIMSFIYKN